MKDKIAGVDEVGRGSLIGPVFAATVVFKSNINKKIIKDSKKVSKHNRAILEKYIKKTLFGVLALHLKKKLKNSTF